VFARWPRIEAIMNKNPITPKIDKLRRNQRIIKRQIQSRTAELEKVNESLRDEITNLKRIEEELNVRLQKRTAELTKVSEALLKEAAERARAAETLRESEAQQSQTSKFNQAVMANMGEGLYTLDTRGLVTYVNPAAERLFGWSSAELIGRKMHDVTHYQHPDGTPFPADECAGLQCCRRDGLIGLRGSIYPQGRDLLPRGYSSSPIKSEGGTVGLVVVFRDMTAQKQVEEALRKSREELQALAARLQASREEEKPNLPGSSMMSLTGL
jgi:PAS domain-containing protein